MSSKSDLIIKGQRAITGDDQMKCMLFNADITFAPNIKNWWQAISLSASNYIGGILEGMMWGAAIGAAGGIAAGGTAVLGEFGVSNVAANWLATWTTGGGLALRGVVAAQTVLGAYGDTGQISGGDVFHGVFGMEVGTWESAKKIVTGNGTVDDVIGVALWFTPAHGRSQKSRTITEEGKGKEGKKDEGKNEEKQQARGNESEASRQKGERDAYQIDPGKPWEEGRNPYRYQRYLRQFKRRHILDPDRKPLSPEEWWNEHGKQAPHSPSGDAGVLSTKPTWQGITNQII
ncbi:MAG: hypothetical protein J2P21_00555 [Chloracidobacterium sp.]|nr:hypothetical protein [Chloracidobacterium sp.]